MQKLALQHLSFSSLLSPTELLHKFQAHQAAQGLTLKTRRDYDYHVTAYVQTIRSISDATPDQLREYLAGLQARGLSANTVRGRYRVLKTFFNFVRMEEVIEANPMDKIKPPKKPNHILPALSVGEVQTLTAYFRGRTPLKVRDTAIWMVMLDSALRLAEVTSLTVGQVDPTTGIIKVRGKGDKDRFVKLGKRSMEALAQWCKGRGGEAGDPLWLGVRGSLTERGIAQVFRRASSDTGIYVTPHKVRRTAAVMMLRSGMNLAVLSRYLGHANLSTTQIYLDLGIADIVADHTLHSPVDGLL